MQRTISLSKSVRLGLTLCLTGLLIVMLILPGYSARAISSVCTVTNSSDGTSPVPIGSLREAVSGTCGYIGFDNDYTITLASALPDLARTMTIDGTGHTIIVDGGWGGGGGGVRVFNITSAGNVTLQNLTIRNGRAIEDGAGINNQGTLTVTNSIFAENYANDKGGGIYSTGSLTVQDSTIDDNYANQQGGAGIYNDEGGTLTVTNSTFFYNTASDSYGGAIYNASSLTLTNSTLAYNHDNGGGAGLYSISGSSTSMANTIIAVIAESATSPECSIAGTFLLNLHNLVGDGTCSGGGVGFLSGNDMLGLPLDNGGPTLTVALLPGSPAIDAGDYGTCSGSPVNGVDQRGVSRTDPSGKCDIGAYEVHHCTVTNALDGGSGSLRDTLANHTCGVIDFAANFTITLGSQLEDIARDLTIDGADPHVVLDGGGLYRIFSIVDQQAEVHLHALTLQNGSAPKGGAIYNGGSLFVDDSTLVDNRADETGGAIDNESSLSLANSTLAGNQAANGGAIYNLGDADMYLSNNTLAGNEATSAGGAIQNDSWGIRIVNNILANNTSAGGGACTGSYDNLGGNLAWPDDGTCPSTFTHADPKLAALADNGGPTQTMALLPGSPAIDAGDAATCKADPVDNLDQRGVTRPTACDIGAFESQGFTLAKTGGDNQSTLINTAFANPLGLTVTANNTVEPVNGGLITFSGPSSDASTNPAVNTATISSGAVSQNVTANGTSGSYNVLAGAAGAENITFALMNCPANSDLITVVNNADSGPGSLRQAILDVCPGGTIKFDNDTTITLLSTLTIDKNMTIDGAGHQITLSGDANASGKADDGDVRVFWVNPGLTFTLKNLTVTDGYAPTSGPDGGGMWVAGKNGSVTSVDIDHVTFSNNIDAYNNMGGGGLGAYNTYLTLTDVTFKDNQAYLGGGMATTYGTATITGATFSGNSTQQLNPDGYGCGGLKSAMTNLSLTNVTFSNNSAGTGGAMCKRMGSATLTNVTFSGNQASLSGAALDDNSSPFGGTVTITNSILWDNISSTITEISDSGSSSTVATYSDIQGGWTGDGNLNLDPKLGPLQDNSGPTWTMALLPGSPAIDAGVSSTCSAAAGSPDYGAGGKDQRGVTRPSACDMGAFESQGFTLTKTGGDNQSTPINTDFTNPLTLTVGSAFNEPVNGGQVTFTPPATDASAVITDSPATIASGAVSVTATANGTAGSYAVTASAAGATSVNFSLTNLLPDTTPPVVTAFTATTPSNSFNIPITAFTAYDAVGVTGYLITTTSTPPLASDPGWAGTAPITYTVASDGTYTLYPWAKDAAGNVSAVFKTPRTVVVNTTAFSKTAPANAAPNQPANPVLSWGASSGASAYWVCYDTTNDNACYNWTNNGTATSVTLSGLSPNTTYYWQVRAVNGSSTIYANGSSKAFWSFKTAAYPSAFKKDDPDNGATNQPTTPTLSWGSSSGASAYRYCYDTTNDNACSNWVNNGTARSVTLSRLSPNTIYYWHVLAVNSSGTTYSNGSATAFWSFTTGSLPVAFVKTAPANGVSGQPASTTLSWGSSTGAYGYWYCYDTTNDNACSNWVNNGTATSKVLSGLAPSTTYYWQIKAVNAIGITYANGSGTAFWSFTTGSLPAAFNKISPANGATSQPYSLVLSWGSSTGATRYEVCYGKTNSCSNWTSVGTATSMALSGLKGKTTYYWQVRAVDANGITYANATTTDWWFKTK